LPYSSAISWTAGWVWLLTVFSLKVTVFKFKNPCDLD
jgi:hypothetical protein